MKEELTYVTKVEVERIDSLPYRTKENIDDYNVMTWQIIEIPNLCNFCSIFQLDPACGFELHEGDQFQLIIVYSFSKKETIEKLEKIDIFKDKSETFYAFMANRGTT